jgi:hypothetical protein
VVAAGRRDVPVLVVDVSASVNPVAVAGGSQRALEPVPAIRHKTARTRLEASLALTLFGSCRPRGRALLGGREKIRPSPGAQARAHSVHTLCRQTVNDLELKGAVMSASARPFYPLSDRQPAQAGDAA